jgi:hypothetical protein
VLISHDDQCEYRGRAHSDAAKRVSDGYRLHKMAAGHAAAGRWMAVALADGASDGVLYDSKRDAVRHQHHNELWYAFLPITPGDVSVCEAETYLEVNRMLSRKNIVMTDPDHASGGPEVIRRLALEDDRSLMASIASGGRSRPSNLLYDGYPEGS